jgi:hypothetical protein
VINIVPIGSVLPIFPYGRVTDPYCWPVRLFAAGESPVAVVAVGLAPTGVIAIGEFATGVLAVGQLARGVIVIGQLAVGLVVFGQLAVGAGWAGGQLAIGAFEGPRMVGLGALGKLGLGDLISLRWTRATRYRLVGHRRWVGPLVVLAALALAWFVAFAPLLHDLTRVGGILRESPPPLR